SFWSLDGTPLDPDETPLWGVFANYVGCVAGCAPVQKRGGGSWATLFAGVDANVPDDAEHDPDAILTACLQHVDEPLFQGTLQLQLDWRVERPTWFETSNHAAVVERTLADVSQGTLVYPIVFVEALRALAPRLAPGGCFFVNDFGHVDPAMTRGCRHVSPSVYAGTVNHPLYFAVFDALAEVWAWQHARTRDPLRTLHHAVLSPTGDASALEAAFRRCYVDRDDGERYTTLVAGAGRCFNAGDYLYAARQYRG